MFQTAYNSSDQPVPIDAQGRTIAGRDWEAVDDSLPEVIHAVENGTLVFVDDIGSGAHVDPRAAAALHRTQELNGPALHKPSGSKGKEKD